MYTPVWLLGQHKFRWNREKEDLDALADNINNIQCPTAQLSILAIQREIGEAEVKSINNI